MIDSSHQTLLTQLQQTWHQTIPVSEFMQIAPLAFDGANFEVSAPLEPNINPYDLNWLGHVVAATEVGRAGW